MWLKDVPQYQTVISDESGLKLNQTAPAVWGDIVVYEHETAGGDVDIYARDMSQSDSEPFLIAGDVDGNCRVDLVDFVLLAEGWLACGLEPATACGT